MFTSEKIIQYIMDSSIGGFPPSFEGNPWIFALALFCTMVASLVCLLQIYSLFNEIIKAKAPLTNPISIYRFQLILAYLAVMIGCGPDAVYLWTYNEVSPAATNIILNIDRICDSLFLVPFMLFTWLQVLCGPTIKYQLLIRALPITIPKEKNVLRLNLLAGLLIFVMSVVVTLSK